MTRNQSTYNSKLLRAEPAAPAARPGVIGTVNSYWVEKRKRRLASKAARKQANGRVGPQAHKGANYITKSHTSQEKKQFDKPIDLWDKVI